MSEPPTPTKAVLALLDLALVVQSKLHLSQGLRPFGCQSLSCVYCITFLLDLSQACCKYTQSLAHCAAQLHCKQSVLDLAAQ